MPTFVVGHRLQQADACAAASVTRTGLAGILSSSVLALLEALSGLLLLPAAAAMYDLTRPGWLLSLLAQANSRSAPARMPCLRPCTAGCLTQGVLQLLCSQALPVHHCCRSRHPGTRVGGSPVAGSLRAGQQPHRQLEECMAAVAAAHAEPGGLGCAEQPKTDRRWVANAQDFHVFT